MLKIRKKDTGYPVKQKKPRELSVSTKRWNSRKNMGSFKRTVSGGQARAFDDWKKEIIGRLRCSLVRGVGPGSLRTGERLGKEIYDAAA